MSTDTELRDTPSAPSSSARRWKWLAGAAALVAAVAIAVAAFAITGGNDGSDSQSHASQRIAATRNACQQWLDDSSTRTGATSDRGWCNGMADWMYDQIRNGTMGPQMMWGSPQAMIGACRQWMTSVPETNATTTTSGAGAGAAPATGWCDQMVGWMSRHMGDWDGYGDWDDHMDDGHWSGMMNP